MQADLVVLSLGGVQRFLSESRTTAEVAGASAVVRDLAQRAAEMAQERVGAGGDSGFGLVVPAAVGGASDRVTNKVVVLVPRGDGSGLARDMAATVRERWSESVEAVFPGGELTPGFPDVSWVRVSGSAADDDYEMLWERASAALVARRRARGFEPLVRRPVELCGQAPQLPGVAVPATVARPQELRDGERLSAAGWVKRAAGRRENVSFPSTVSVASASFRARLLAKARDAGPAVRAELVAVVGRLDAVVRELDAPRERPLGLDAPGDLRGLLRHGSWVWPQRWAPDALAAAGVTAGAGVAARGRAAAVDLARVARQLQVPAATPYYAVVVQDLDHLGRALGRLGLADQRVVSRQLAELAQAQWAAAGALESPAAPVYAGGDDFLAFCPAASALELAARLRGLVVEHLAAGPLGAAGADGAVITASTAVVFAHMSSPLGEVVASAREALHAAKSATGWDRRSRDALAVVVRRRGGVRARLVQPWRPDRSAADRLSEVRPRGGGALSAGLASRLEVDRDSLQELADGQWLALSAELRRLVVRQGGTERAAEELVDLGRWERTSDRFDPVPAALVARFLTQECR